MNSFINRRLAITFSGLFLTQPDFESPLSAAQINTRHPQSEPTFPSRIVNREQVRSCSGEFIIQQKITSRLMRLRFAFDCDAYLAAGWLGLAMSAITAPSGTRANEVQTITPSAAPSAGTWNVAFDFEGITDNVDIAWNATAAQIQEALESLSSIGKGNVLVTGTLASTVVVTFQGALAAFNVPMLTLDDTGLTGATLAIAQTTAGVPKISNIAMTTSQQTKITSIIVGFEGDTTPPDRYKSVCVNEVIIRGSLRGKVSVELDVYASLDTDSMIGYTMPACVDQDPIYTKDCRLQLDSGFSVRNIREFTYTYSNNIYVNDDPFPYDGIDVFRLEHGDRVVTLNWSEYGSKGDANYDSAENEETKNTKLIIGPPTNRLIAEMPKLNLALDDTVITFAGEASRSAFGVQGLALFDGATAGTPSRAFYYGAETNTIGLSA